VSIPSQAFKPSHLVPVVPSANWQLEALVGNAVGAFVGALVGATVHLSTFTSVHDNNRKNE